MNVPTIIIILEKKKRETSETLAKVQKRNLHLEAQPGLINLCVLFLDAQSAPNKGSVDAQNKIYAHSLCLRQQQRGEKCMLCHRMYFLGSGNIFVFLDAPRVP